MLAPRLSLVMWRPKVERLTDEQHEAAIAGGDAAALARGELLVAWKLIATGISPTNRTGSSATVSRLAAPSITTGMPLERMNSLNGARGTGRPNGASRRPAGSGRGGAALP
jgi:hypothetical protein